MSSAVNWGFFSTESKAASFFFPAEKTRPTVFFRGGCRSLPSWKNTWRMTKTPRRRMPLAPHLWSGHRGTGHWSLLLCSKDPRPTTRGDQRGHRGNPKPFRVRWTRQAKVSRGQEMLARTQLKAEGVCDKFCIIVRLFFQLVQLKQVKVNAPNVQNSLGSETIGETHPIYATPMIGWFWFRTGLSHDRLASNTSCKRMRSFTSWNPMPRPSQRTRSFVDRGRVEPFFAHRVDRQNEVFRTQEFPVGFA